jgi:chromatin modification-related protein VID21
MAAQRQASMQGMQGQMGIANGVAPPQRNGTPGGNLNVPSQMPSVSAQPGHAGNPNMAARQQHPAQQGLPASFPNGNLSGISMNTPSVPQAQMQTNIPGNQRMAPPDQVRMAMQRAQYPNTNQHQFQLQQQQINMASNITANMNMGNNIPNANMMASIAGQNMNGNMNAPLPVTPNSAGSPRMNQLNSQMQSPARPLSSGHMPHLLQIQNSLKAQHPDWPPEQIQKQASDHLQRILAKQRAQAMNAAAGAASGITSSPQLGNNVYLQNGGMQNSPSPNPVQSYQTQLLQQQRMMNQRQQQAGSPAMSARPMSRSATPQNPQQLPLQSPGGAHQGRS